MGKEIQVQFEWNPSEVEYECRPVLALAEHLQSLYQSNIDFSGITGAVGG
jgi:hypothetical protein